MQVMAMAIQFWNDDNTKESFEVMRRLVGKIDFVLIGGWAVFYYTGQQKSLDIDIAIDYGALDYFKEYGISQYEGMHIQYSIIERIYIDLFIDGFSDRDLPFPVKDIMDGYVMIEGIKVVEKELLILLKTWGYFRVDEKKHDKDIIDTLSLLFFANLDFAKIRGYITKYKIPEQKGTGAMLEYLALGKRFIANLDISEGEFLRRKAFCIKQLHNIE